MLASGTLLRRLGAALSRRVRSRKGARTLEHRIRARLLPIIDRTCFLSGSIALAVAVTFALAPPVRAEDPHSVFFIQRNKNKNEVHYAISLDENCRPKGDDPVKNYWLRLEDGPNVEKSLKLLQQVGYGIKSQKVTDEGVLVVLRSLPARPISVVVTREGTECKAAAYMTVAGERAHLERAYVFAKDGFLLPAVAYVELFGKRDDGSPVEERIQPE